MIHFLFPFIIIAFLIGGFAKAKEGIEETIRNKQLNVEMLMIFAAIGSAFIGYWTEGAILIFIFAISGALETYTLNKSHKEISALMELQPEEAWLLREDGTETKVPNRFPTCRFNATCEARRKDSCGRPHHTWHLFHRYVRD